MSKSVFLGQNFGPNFLFIIDENTKNSGIAKEIFGFFSAQLIAHSASAAISQIELLNLSDPLLSRSSAQAAKNRHLHSKQLRSANFK